MNETEQKTCFFFEDKYINFDKTKDVFITNIVTCILNFLFALATCFGNFLIVFTIRKNQDLHSPSFILLGCLAASDAIVGLISQPLFVAYKIAELKESFAAFCTLKMLQSLSGWITTGASLTILAAISVDRLLALNLHLRYNTIVTVPRVFQATFLFWVLCIVMNVIRFWMTKEWYFVPVITISLTCFVIMVSSMRIFQIFLRHQRQINDQTMAVSQVQSLRVKVLKCRKTAVTIFYIYGLALIFYLPFLAVVIADLYVVGFTRSVRIAYDYASTVILINSFINPLVYCWRIREIRRAVKNILRVTSFITQN